MTNSVTCATRALLLLALAGCQDKMGAESVAHVCRARFGLAHTAAESLIVAQRVTNAFGEPVCAEWLGRQMESRAARAGGRP